MINKYGNLGERIKVLRTSLGLSMEEFGKMFDPPANKSIVSKWERNDTEPKSDRLKRIAELGNVSVHFLLTGKPEPITHQLSDERVEYEIKLQEELWEEMEFNNYKRIHYPDVLDILEKEAPALNKKVFYNKKPLDNKTKNLAKEYLDFITKDMKEDYPSEEEIQKEIEQISNIKKTLENMNKEKGD